MSEEQRTIAEVDILDHGIVWPDYFQGAGVAFTQFDDCATGSGDTFADAIDDAIEQAAQSGVVNVEQLEQLLRDECATHSGDWPASESASASVEPDAPEDSYRVSFAAFCGMAFDIVDDASRDDARREAAARLRALRRRGQTVTILTRGESWEACDPDDSAMVSDNAGVLSLVDETPEAPEVDDWPSYFVTIRWKYA